MISGDSRASCYKRALAVSVALHVIGAAAVPLLPRAHEPAFQSGEILTLSKVTRVTVSHREPPRTHAPALKRREPAVAAIVAPQIAHATPAAPPRPKRPAGARPQRIAMLAAAPRPGAAAGDPGPETLGAAAVVTNDAPAAEATEAPKAPVASIARSSGGPAGWGTHDDRALLMDDQLIAYLRTKLGRFFRIKVKLDENGTPLAITFIAPNLDEAVQQEIRARIMTARFDPQKRDGITFGGEVELPPN